MTRFRPLLGLLLALTVLVSSVESALAQWQMAGAVGIELCADGQDSALMLDAAGRPVSHRNACPHCLVAASAAVLTGEPLAPWTRAERRSERVTLARGPAAIARPIAKPDARGPPTSI